MSLQTLLVVILIVLITGLVLGLVSYLLRPNRKRDVMQQAIGDAPRFPRGGYAALDEQAPIAKGGQRS